MTDVGEATQYCSPAKANRKRRGSKGGRPVGFDKIRRTEPGGEALENQWSSAAVRHYRAGEPRRLGKDVPLYTL
jgi:hypothetical protein